MVFTFDFDTLPVVTDIYKIERKTVWQTADDNNILVLIIDGDCIFHINGKDYITRKGNLFFIPPMQEYTRCPKDDTPCTLVYFHFITNSRVDTLDAKNAHDRLSQLKMEMDNALIKNDGKSLPRLSKIYVFRHIITAEKYQKDVFEYTERALDELHKNNIDSHVLLSLYLYHILAIAAHLTVVQLMSEYELKLEDNVPSKLKKAIIFIKNNLTERITINDICGYCNISPQHLIRIFKMELKTTPTQYINMLRISRAKDLIRRAPIISIKEIAYETGFDNPHYFSRLFTKLSGQTPSEFKARIRIPNDDFIDGVPKQ